jgi:hypothetical protein
VVGDPPQRIAADRDRVGIGGHDQIRRALTDIDLIGFDRGGIVAGVLDQVHQPVIGLRRGGQPLAGQDRDSRGLVGRALRPRQTRRAVDRGVDQMQPCARVVGQGGGCEEMSVALQRISSCRSFAVRLAG